MRGHARRRHAAVRRCQRPVPAGVRGAAGGRHRRPAAGLRQRDGHPVLPAGLRDARGRRRVARHAGRGARVLPPLRRAQPGHARERGLVHVLVRAGLRRRRRGRGVRALAGVGRRGDGDAGGCGFDVSACVTCLSFPFLPTPNDRMCVADCVCERAAFTQPPEWQSWYRTQTVLPKSGNAGVASTPSPTSTSSPTITVFSSTVYASTTSSTGSQPTQETNSGGHRLLMWNPP
ncbi:hypothetical protein F4819DRAFT_46188 [Hypoxylon fuscum]|nr:hypothetical protein F4819DRAFT_46188 [Hypoxylon fuscum]